MANVTVKAQYITGNGIVHNAQVYFLIYIKFIGCELNTFHVFVLIYHPTKLDYLCHENIYHLGNSTKVYSC